jgi:putative ABC transport system permease protein
MVRRRFESGSCLVFTFVVAWLIFPYFPPVKTFRLALEALRTALHSLRVHRLRSLLTMLGVAIGIFAITIIFTLVNSLDYSMSQSINNLGNTTLLVYHIPWTNDIVNWQKYFKRPHVNHDEYLALKRELRYVDGVSYEARIRSQTIRHGERALEFVGLRAVSEDYIWMNALDLEAGRPLTELETNAGRPACVIGKEIAAKLFPNENPVGKWLRIRGKKIKVVGVLAKSGANMFGANPDELVYLPYGFAARIYDMESPFIDPYLGVRVSSLDRMAAVEQEITGIMRKERGMRPSAENEFEINRPEMLINLFSDATNYLRIGGLVISFFSVIVGGFGIGNIMYTTVKERTFEIGLQKALGAKRGFILFQFLSESVLLCLLGGLLGLLLNYGVTQLIQLALAQMQTEFSIVVSGKDILIGLALSGTIGLVSGFVPSLAAARMDPVESMRA